MRSTLLILLGSGLCEMHLLRGGRVIGTVAFELGEEVETTDALTAAYAQLESLPGVAVRSARVMVVAEAPHIQIRRLRPDPSASAAQSPREQIALCPQRWFLSTSDSLLTLTGPVEDDGTFQAAACNETLFSALEAFSMVCRGPFLGVAAVDGILTPDSAAATEIAETFRTAPLVFVSRRGRSRVGSLPRWRLFTASSVLVASILFAALAPIVTARLRAREASRALSQLGETGTRSGLLMARLSLSRDRLDELRRFRDNRHSVVSDLLSLARALPAGAAALSVRFDSTTATIVALAPRAGALVAALDSMPGFTGAEVIGPITREAPPVAAAAAAASQGPKEFDRLTVRVRRAGTSGGRR